MNLLYVSNAEYNNNIKRKNSHNNLKHHCWTKLLTSISQSTLFKNCRYCINTERFNI
jgi:hypothetical protein